MKPLRRALALASVLVFGSAALARAQAPEATLPSQCNDQVAAPATVVLTCADAGLIADGLTWTGWGSAQTTASGTATAKTCDPDCATGGTGQYPITLTASNLRDCGYGEPQYTLITYAFPADSPYPPGSPGAEDPTVRFPCPTRPHGDPRIRAMRMRLTGHGNPGAIYYVRVSIRLRVCGVRGRSHVTFNETLGGGGTVIGEDTHTSPFRQVARCQWRTFKWKLRDEFFGVGTYKVGATVYDKDTQFSNTVSRRHTTID